MPRFPISSLPGTTSSFLEFDDRSALDGSIDGDHQAAAYLNNKITYVELPVGKDYIDDLQETSADSEEE